MGEINSIWDNIESALSLQGYRLVRSTLSTCFKVARVRGIIYGAGMPVELVIYKWFKEGLIGYHSSGELPDSVKMELILAKVWELPFIPGEMDVGLMRAWSTLYEMNSDLIGVGPDCIKFRLKGNPMELRYQDGEVRLIGAQP